MQTFVFDAYAGKTLEEMKVRAGELGMHLMHWQMTVAILAKKNGTTCLDDERSAEVKRLIESYED